MLRSRRANQSSDSFDSPRAADGRAAQSTAKGPVQGETRWLEQCLCVCLKAANPCRFSRQGKQELNGECDSFWREMGKQLSGMMSMAAG